MGYRCSSAGLQRRDAVLTPQSSVQRGRCEQPNGNVTAITMSPRRVALFFAIVVLSLSIIHAAGQFSRFFLDDGYLHGIVPMFTFGAEHNVPAYYSALAIFSCALLLAIIAIGERARRIGRRLLGGAGGDLPVPERWTRRWLCTNASSLRRKCFSVFRPIATSYGYFPMRWPCS